jgi:hypothetical protein
MIVLYILLVVGGYLIRENPQWFDNANGTDTVGLILMIAGAALIVMWVIMLLAASTFFNRSRF